MTSDQTFRKIKKRARKDGLSQPRVISRKGNRWFLIDKMNGTTAPSQLFTKLIQRGMGELSSQLERVELLVKDSDTQKSK